MMRRILLAVLAISVAACAAVPEFSSTPLYDEYLRYREAVINGSVLAKRAEIFSSSVLDDIDITSEKEVKVLLWANSILKEHSHYEKIEQGRGCLTINGYADDDGKPVSLFIEYEGRLVKSQHLDFPDRKRSRGFFERALCPEEAHEEIMRNLEVR